MISKLKAASPRIRLLSAERVTYKTKGSVIKYREGEGATNGEGGTSHVLPLQKGGGGGTTSFRQSAWGGAHKDFRQGTSVLAKLKGGTNNFHSFEWEEEAGGGGGAGKVVP